MFNYFFNVLSLKNFLNNYKNLRYFTNDKQTPIDQSSSLLNCASNKLINATSYNKLNQSNNNSN